MSAENDATPEAAPDEDVVMRDAEDGDEDIPALEEVHDDDDDDDDDDDKDDDNDDDDDGEEEENEEEVEDVEVDDDDDDDEEEEDDGRGDMIASLCQLTGLQWEESRLFLDMSGWDLSRAAEIFYADHREESSKSREDTEEEARPQQRRPPFPRASAAVASSSFASSSFHSNGGNNNDDSGESFEDESAPLAAAAAEPPRRAAAMAYPTRSNAVLRILGGAWSAARRFARSAPVSTGREAARKFAEAYEATYGRRGGRAPTFCVESYKAAARLAHSRSKALLVFLHCPLHQDADDFCVNVLNSPEVARYLAAHFVVWGADVSSADGRVLMDALRVARLPFLAVLVCRVNAGGTTNNGSSPSPQHTEELVDRVQGVVDARAVLARLSRASRAYRRRAAAARRLDATRRRDRALRREQDAEFQASLEADRKKEQLARERQRQQELAEAKEKEAAEVAERLAEEARLRKLRDLDNARARLGDEPPPGKSARVRVQLPNGTKVDRRFPSEATIEHLRDFVKVYVHDHGLQLTAFQFATNYPRRVFHDLKGDDDDDNEAQDARLPIRELNGKVVYVQDLDA